MSPQFKKFIPIFLAVVFGAGIIFFSIKGDSLFGSKVSFDTKNDILEQNDSWKNTLQVVPQNLLVKLSTNETLRNGSSATTTATSLLGRNILASYVLAQGVSPTTRMSDADAEVIAQRLIERATEDTTIKQYTEKDILIVKLTPVTFEKYSKGVSQALNTFTQKNTVNELEVVMTAINSKDQAELAELNTTVASLQALLRSLLATKVPQELTGFHLLLIQQYALVLSGVVDMQQIVTDPALGMRGVAKYNQGMSTLLTLKEQLGGIY